MRIEYGPVSAIGSSAYTTAVMDALRRLTEWDIQSFDRFPTHRADVVVWCKRPDRLRILAAARPIDNVIFLPVDSYRDAEAARRETAAEFRGLKAIVAPSQAWVEDVRPPQPTFWIPHPARHFRHGPPKQSRATDILCVAASVYADDVNAWLAQANPPNPVRILASEPHRFHGRQADIVREWTPELQDKWTAQCGVAVDVKTDSFWHRTKPSTKAVEMLSAGLPVAVHPSSAAFREIRDLTGLALPGLDDVARLLSPALTRVVEEIRETVARIYSIDSIARRWLEDLPWTT